MVILKLLLHCRSGQYCHIVAKLPHQANANEVGVRFMKRSRDAIISKILDVCTDGAHKTRIVYQANLNFRTVNPYLELLTKSGMMITQEDRNLILYQTTARGLALLDNYRQFQYGLSLIA